MEGYPGYQHLLSLAEKCMEIVCETQGKLLPYGFGKHGCAHLIEPKFSDCQVVLHVECLILYIFK